MDEGVSQKFSPGSRFDEIVSQLTKFGICSRQNWEKIRPFLLVILEIQLEKLTYLIEKTNPLLLR